MNTLRVAQPTRVTWHLTVAAWFSRKLYEWRLRRLHRLLVKLTPDSNMVSHCQRELASWFAEGEDSPNRWMADAVERLVRLHATEGHSGSSAPFAIAVFKEVAAFKPWGPLTGADDEWMEPWDGADLLQNRRCSRVFSDKDGAYDSEGRVFRTPSGSCYTNRDSRVRITFPYTPKTEYVDVPE